MRRITGRFGCRIFKKSSTFTIKRVFSPFFFSEKQITGEQQVAQEEEVGQKKAKEGKSGRM